MSARGWLLPDDDEPDPLDPENRHDPDDHRELEWAREHC